MVKDNQNEHGETHVGVLERVCVSKQQFFFGTLRNGIGLPVEII